MKFVTGKSDNSISSNFKDGAKKAEILFFETEHKFSRQRISSKMRGELKDMSSRGTDIKVKKVWVKIQNSEMYEISVDKLL